LKRKERQNCYLIIQKVSNREEKKSFILLAKVKNILLFVLHLLSYFKITILLLLHLSRHKGRYTTV